MPIKERSPTPASRRTPLRAIQAKRASPSRRHQHQNCDSQRDHPGEVISHPVEVEVDEPLLHDHEPDIEEARNQPDPGRHQQRRASREAPRMGLMPASPTLDLRNLALCDRPEASSNLSSFIVETHELSLQ